MVPNTRDLHEDTKQRMFCSF